MGCLITSGQISGNMDIDIKHLKTLIKSRIQDMAMGYLESPLNRVMTGTNVLGGTMNSIKDAMSNPQFPYIPKDGASIKQMVRNLGQGILQNGQGMVKNMITSGMQNIIMPLPAMAMNNSNLAFENVNAFRSNVNNLRIPLSDRTSALNLPKTKDDMKTLLTDMFCGGAQNLLGMSGNFTSASQFGNITGMLNQNMTQSLMSGAMGALGGLEGNLLSQGMGMEKLAPMSKITKVQDMEMNLGRAPTDFSDTLGTAGLKSTGAVDWVNPNLQPENPVPMSQQVQDNYEMVKEEINTHVKDFGDMIDSHSDKMKELYYNKDFNFSNYQQEVDNL
jgi:hypothetical protein